MDTATATVEPIDEQLMNVATTSHRYARPECVYAASLRFRAERGDRLWRSTATGLEQLVLGCSTAD